MNYLTVNELYIEMETNDLLEDRREYDQAQLQTSYPHLNPGEVTELYEMIQKNFVNSEELDAAVASIVQHPGMKVKRGLVEYVAESQHSNWEGYTAAEVKAITAFMKDFVMSLDDGMGESDYFDVTGSITID